MRVARIGLTVLKGTRHQAQDVVELTAHGPVGDRIFCLVDPYERRVLKTVAHPALVQAVVSYRDGVLHVDLPGTMVSAVPEWTGSRFPADYWGREVELEVVDGPWGYAFGRFLARPVLLARTQPGAVVYGDAVSLVTSASLSGLRPHRRFENGNALRLDPERDSARFRSTLVIDTSGGPYAQPGSELVWAGHDLQVGEAVVRLTASIPRCAVVDVNPVTGVRDVRLLGALPIVDGEPVFGLQGVVVRPGLVRRGARVELSSCDPA